LKYIQVVDPSKEIEFDEAFEKPFGTHGKFKVGFGVGSDSVDNPTSVCVHYNAGDRLLESADFSFGDSPMSGMMGGDRILVVADKPFAMEEDTDCHILGVLKAFNEAQPKLFEGDPLEEAIGGASRFDSFVSETGAPEEDPKPREVRDNTDPEPYYVNRLAGQAAWGDYYVHIYRLNVIEGKAYPALTLETSGSTPDTDTTFPKPEPAPAHDGDYNTITIEGVEYYLVPVE
jgi:hypothetical protein